MLNLDDFKLSGSLEELLHSTEVAEEPVKVEEPENEVVETAEVVEVVEAEAPVEAAPVEAVVVPAKGTVIAEDVIINGNITSHSDLEIKGTVEGDVICEGAMKVSGSILGQVRAMSLELVKGNIQGDIVVQESLVARDGTDIHGDIKAGSAELEGNVKGALTIAKGLVIRETSIIFGDVKAGDISMCMGVKLRGKLEIGFSDEEQETEETSAKTAE